MRNEERIQSFLEDRLSEEESEAFAVDVTSDPELRSAYAEAAWVHGQLMAHRDELPALLGIGEAGADSLSRSNRTGSRRAPVLAWGLAACLAAALAVIVVFRPSAPPTVAALEEAADCRWAGSELPTHDGARLGPGLLDLAEGMATLAFDNGARVTLEAPARLEILSAMECRLLDGSVVADVPDTAHGFTIRTRQMDIVDLGTRFGVATSEFGNSHVYVFDGEVEVHRGRAGGSDPENAGTPQRLVEGASLHVGEKAPIRGEEMARDLPEAPVGEGWTAVTTLTGEGRDAFVRRHDDTPRGRDPLLMVKHTTLAAGNERRALLTFDLRGIDLARVTEARLSLTTESSGLGFSAMVPDSRFAVHAPLHDSWDDWDEADLTWETAAPGLTADSPAPGTFSRLGAFDLPRGRSPGQVDLSSPALAELVRRDGNGLITFLVVRETDEFDEQGLVHAFAAREHPRSRPPTLWIRLSPQEP